MKGRQEQLVLTGESGVLAVAAHEIKTPLVLINHLSDTLLEDSKDLDQSEVREYLSRIKLTSERVLRLANQIILNHKISANDQIAFDFRLEPINVTEICQQVAGELNHFANAYNQHIVIKKHPKTLVIANREILHDSLMNLVENAVMHNPAGSQVTLSSRVVENKLRISVRDYGPAASTHEIEQLITTTSDGRKQPIFNRPNSGIGLLIVKQLVGAMGGHFGAGATKQGSSFFIDLMRSNQLNLFQEHV